jgi:hypothetical protein
MAEPIEGEEPNVPIFKEHVEEAYETKNLTRLQEMALYYVDNKASSDNYFWYYLSLDGDLFYPIYSEQKQMKTGNFENGIHTLIAPIKLVEVDPHNCGAEDMITKNRSRIKGEEEYYSAGPEEAHTSLNAFLGDPKLIRFINEITTNPNIVISGGLPASCIYQHINNRGVGNSFSTDIDIFFLNPSTATQDFLYIAERASEILGIRTLANINNLVYNIYYKRNNENVKIQMIGRKYTDLNQIALAFDLDSSCAFYYRGSFCYHNRFYRAVKYAHNVINPYRKSKSYLYRLRKYLERGFTVHIPGNIQQYRMAVGARKICSQVLGDYGHSRQSDYESGTVSIEEDIRVYSQLPEFRHEFMMVHGNDLYGIVVLSYNKGVRGYILGNLNNFTTATWLLLNPGTQIAGSFNPIHFDILKYGLIWTPQVIADTQNEIEEEEV